MKKILLIMFILLCSLSVVNASSYNTPYKSGTFNGVPSGTTFTVSGFTPQSSDVGRIIIVTTGDARLQHREIIGVSGQDISIAHAWDTQPFIDTSSDGRASDVLPDDGDGIVISYDVADLIASDSDMTLTVDNVLQIDDLAVSDYAYIHFKGYNINWDYRDIKIFQTAGLIMGYYGYVEGEDGYVKISSNIYETADNFNGGIFGSSSSMGMLDIYGGNIIVKSGLPFWRAYSTEAKSRDQQARFIDVTTYGNFGSRVGGDRSILKMYGVGSDTTVGISNPRTSVARVELSIFDSDQAGYVFLNSNGGGPSGRLVFPRLRDINLKIIRSNNGGHSGTNVMEVIAKKNEIDEIVNNGGVFIQGTGNPSGSHTYRYGNLIKPSYLDSSVTAISDEIKTRLYDVTNTFITENSINDSIYPEQFIRHTDIATINGDMNLEDGTQYAPYSLRSISYGKQMVVSVINAEDTYNPEIILLDDLSISELNQSIVQNYSEINNAGKFYDASVNWLFDNITNESSFLADKIGNKISSEYDIVVDALANKPFDFNGTTIIIKSTIFEGSLESSGLITLLNGASVSGTIQDSEGLRVKIIINTDGNETVYIENTNTSEVLYNQTLNNSNKVELNYIFNGTENTLIKVRKDKMKPFETSSLQITENGLSLVVSLEDDLIYGEMGVNGSSVTGLSIQNNPLRILINEPTNQTTLQEIYTWWIFETAKPEYMDVNPESFRALTSVEVKSFNDLKLKNTDSNPLTITGGNIQYDGGIASDIVDAGGSIIVVSSTVVSFSSGDSLCIQKIDDLAVSVNSQSKNIGFIKKLLLLMI